MNKIKPKVGDMVVCVSNNNQEGRLTIGRKYKVIREGSDGIRVVHDAGAEYTFYHDRFEMPKPLTIEEQIELAKSFFGKSNLIDKNGKNLRLIPTKCRVLLKGEPSSFAVDEYLRDNDYCVVLSDENIRVYPLMWTKEIESKTVKLNNKYEAEVSKNFVKVGCQTFTYESIEELYKTMQQFKNQ